MSSVRISETELARDVHAVLEKVQQGVEVIIEQDHRPVAVIKPSKPAGRLLTDVLAELQARGSTAVIDDDFARDIQDSINCLRDAQPPSWD